LFGTLAWGLSLYFGWFEQAEAADPAAEEVAPHRLRLVLPVTQLDFIRVFIRHKFYCYSWWWC
jgi:hypothetical protein